MFGVSEKKVREYVDDVRDDFFNLENTVCSLKRQVEASSYHVGEKRPDSPEERSRLAYLGVWHGERIVRRVERLERRMDALLKLLGYTEKVTEKQIIPKSFKLVKTRKR